MQSKYTTTIIFLIFGYLSMSLVGCDSEGTQNSVPQNTPQDASPFGSGFQPGSSLSPDAFLLAASKGEFFRIEASSGIETLLYDFGRYSIEPIGPADVIGTTAYITAEDNTLNAIDVSTGELYWDILLGEDVGRLGQPTPVICDATICYAMGDSGILFAVDTKESRVLWQSALHPNGDSGEKLLGTPLLVAGDRIYLGVYMHDRLTRHPAVSPRLLVIDRLSGNIVNNISYDSRLSGALAISGNTLIVSTLSGVQALDLSSYSVKWEVSGVQTTPALIQGDSVFLNVVDSSLLIMPYSQSTVSYDLQTGQQRWVVDSGRDEDIFTPTSDGQRIYSAFMGRIVCAGCRRADALSIDMSSGNILWANDFGVTYTPIAALGSLFYSDMRSGPGEPSGFGAVDAATGTLNWINTRLDFVGNDSILVQDGETYRRTTYPDVVE